MTRRTIRLPNGDTIPLAVIKQLIRDQRPIAPEQPTLFPLVTDARPRGERTAAERYLTPSLFTQLEE